jgi:glucose-1-phosphate adenylyltransferase
VIGRGSVIENSVIGVRARVADNVTIRNCYIMGIDVLEERNSHAENVRLGRPALGVGEHSVVEGAIIDKNARIGRNVRVTNQRGTTDSEEQLTHVIRDGVVVIQKSAIVKDGTVI